MKHRLRFDLMRETNRIDKEELELFEYRLAKYMYELKVHAKLNRYIGKTEALVTKFRNQKPPGNATREQVNQWEKNKVDPEESACCHPQVHHLAKYCTSQGSGVGEDLIRIQTETICAASVGQSSAQGGKYQRPRAGACRTAHAGSADRKEHAPNPCGGETDTAQAERV